LKQLIRNEQVIGSNPIIGSTLFPLKYTNISYLLGFIGVLSPTSFGTGATAFVSILSCSPGESIAKVSQSILIADG
jgi:hypothetical protein